MILLYDAEKNIWHINGTSFNAELISKNMQEGTYTTAIEINENDLSILEAIKGQDNKVKVRVIDGDKEAKIIRIEEVNDNPYLTQITVRVPHKRMLRKA